MTHDEELARAFDGQAERFSKAPLPNDPVAIRNRRQFAALKPDSRVLEAGCGPGIVAEALLAAGHRVTAVDLSAEMIERAHARCSRFGEKARFVRAAIADAPEGPFDAAISRFVLHHVSDPIDFIKAQARRLRAGGAVIASDHTTDPDPGRAAWHQQIEKARDKTHTRNLTAGELADLFARAGLERIQLAEDEFQLDFDEWFDRGTPALDKSDVRKLLQTGSARGFAPGAAGIIRCTRVLISGLRLA